MSGESEPRNAASDVLRVNFTRLSDRDFADLSPQRLDEGFTHEDRRSAFSTRPLDASKVVDSIHVYDEMSGGHPVFSIEEVLAVRGDRLALVRSRIDFPERAHETVSLQVFQYDVTVTRCQRSIVFDVADIDAAIDVLDELAAALDD